MGLSLGKPAFDVIVTQCVGNSKKNEWNKAYDHKNTQSIGPLAGGFTMYLYSRKGPVTKLTTDSRFVNGKLTTDSGVARLRKKASVGRVAVPR